jgi:hypothetical protein
MSNSVGQVIYEQLGGNRFKVMTGAHSFTADRNSLTFKLPVKSNSGRIKGVLIELTPEDTYTMKFFREAGSFKQGDYRIEMVKEYTDVYCDQLQGLFTLTTGLYTSL